MSSAMSVAAFTNPAFDPIFERLEEQIGWYDARSRSNMRWYKRLKLFGDTGSAAIIPLLAASHIPQAAIATGLLGVENRYRV